VVIVTTSVAPDATAALAKNRSTHKHVTHRVLDSMIQLRRNEIGPPAEGLSGDYFGVLRAVASDRQLSKKLTTSFAGCSLRARWIGKSRLSGSNSGRDPALDY